MKSSTSSLAACDLYECVETALAVCAAPSFRSADDPRLFEMLKYLGDDDTWALVPDAGSGDEYIPVDVHMACHLLESHFRAWLIVRGFQLQAHCYATRQRWTLVDCLSPADGGGDRLDVDYPTGAEELGVLVASILAVNTL